MKEWRKHNVRGRVDRYCVGDTSVEAGTRINLYGPRGCQWFIHASLCHIFASCMGRVAYKITILYSDTFECGTNGWNRRTGILFSDEWALIAINGSRYYALHFWQYERPPVRGDGSNGSIPKVLCPVESLRMLHGKMQLLFVTSKLWAWFPCASVIFWSGRPYCQWVRDWVCFWS